MALTCANCGSDKNVNVVCHHCGRPLCDSPNCRFPIANDRVFFQPPPRWKRVWQWLTDWFTPEPLSFWARIEAQFAPKAAPMVITYHCTTHKREFHRFAAVVDPRGTASPPTS